MQKNTYNKIGLYILSLSMLFIFIILLSAKIPFCFTSNCSFIGLKSLALTNIVPIVCFIFFLISIYFYKRFKNITKYNGLDSVKITSCQSENYESLTFLATYIVPFMGFSFEDMQKNIAYLLLVIVIGIIFIKTDKYYANPTLALFGFKLYRVDIVHPGSGETKNLIAISNDTLKVGDNVYYNFFDEFVFIARKKI
ncbi:anti-phage protein KwaA [Moellerella wisconsensis]|uniref:anti-phage protein KwaA n=1 Tax=Moellerella wisconsensis TaxID=158849 RepID=UPI00307600D3